MKRLHDWIISSDTHLHIWEIAEWAGLVIVLLLGTVDTVCFLIHPKWVTGIPAMLIVIVWVYLLKASGDSNGGE
jgi:hypothetical protein